MVGEGLIQGGVLLISPSKGVVYTHNEKTGSLLPFQDMQAALDSVQKMEGERIPSKVSKNG